MVHRTGQIAMSVKSQAINLDERQAKALFDGTMRQLARTRDSFLAEILQQLQHSTLEHGQFVPREQGLVLTGRFSGLKASGNSMLGSFRGVRDQAFLDSEKGNPQTSKLECHRFRHLFGSSVDLRVVVFQLCLIFFGCLNE